MTILVLPRPSMCQVTREDILGDLEEYRRREADLCIELMRLRAQRTKTWGPQSIEMAKLIKEKENILDMIRELQRCIRKELGLHDDA